jgi:hypothetical protein
MNMSCVAELDDANPSFSGIFASKASNTQKRSARPHDETAGMNRIDGVMHLAFE